MICSHTKNQQAEFSPRSGYPLLVAQPPNLVDSFFAGPIINVGILILAHTYLIVGDLGEMLFSDLGRCQTCRRSKG